MAVTSGGSSSQSADPNPAEPPPPQAVLLNMIAGKWVAQAISVAAKLKVADYLADGPRSCGELAKALEANPDALYRLLRALASVGVFAEVGMRRFGLTPLAECLRSGVPGSLRAIASYFSAEWSWRTWGDLAATIKTGETAFERIFHMGAFDYFEHHPEDAAEFHEGMTNFSEMSAEPTIKAYDFSQFLTIVDVGGGHGAMLRAILRANPKAHGVVFDAPKVVAGAVPKIEAEGMSARCRAQGGDFFKAVPRNGDAYILRVVIHDWDDARAALILHNCRQAIKPSGKLLLLENVIAPGNEPSLAKLLDLEMLLIPGGRERTEPEYRALLAATGFHLTRIVPTEAPISVIEAVPITH
jgi:hypothetical protein